MQESTNEKEVDCKVKATKQKITQRHIKPTKV
jgi:hypothetical protein